MKKKQILFLGLLTLLLFPFFAWVWIWIFEQGSFLKIWDANVSTGIQIVYGLIIGWATGLIAIKIAYHPQIFPATEKIILLLENLDLKLVDIIFISLCAGVGEEIFFRGAMQEKLGVLFTSLIFVALHGYLNPFNLRMSLYGLYLLLVIIVFGTMRLQWGLLSAITAHAMFDFILLRKVIVDRKNSIGIPEEQTLD